MQRYDLTLTICWVRQGTSAEYRSRFASHMDAFKWVKRDSYLPQGSQGLKAVTKAKLFYDPLELDPEDMVPLASRDPRKLVNFTSSFLFFAMWRCC
jgi:DNA polymerase epsilon subunit 1